MTPGWIVVFESLEVGQFDRDEALRLAVPYATDLGLDPHVLLSSDYESLNPGYWVVYTGPHRDEDDARAACNVIYDRVDNCYPRFLGR